MDSGISMLEAWYFVGRSYYSVPTHPMVEEDQMDSGISMLEAWYFLGCTILYQPIPWYIKTVWTVGLACQESGKMWGIPFCTLLSHGTKERDGQWDWHATAWYTVGCTKLYL